MTSFQAFIEFLDDIKEDYDEDLVLMAHNCFNYDAIILIQNLIWSGLGVRRGIVDNFADSLQISRSVNPHWDHHTLDDLIEYYLDKPGRYGDHDAWQDTSYLSKISFRMANTNGQGFVSFFESRAKKLDFQTKWNRVLNNLRATGNLGRFRRG